MRRRVAFAGLAARQVVLLVALIAAPAAAQDSLEAARARAAADSIEAAKRAEIDALHHQAQEKRAAAAKLKGRETQALGELRRTERELALTHKRLRGLSQRRTRLGEQLNVTRADLERSTVALENQRARLSRRLRSLYKFGPARELEYLLSTRSFAQLMTRWDYLMMIAGQDRMLLEDVREHKNEIESDQRKLESNLTQIKATEKSTARQNQKLSTLRQLKVSTVATIQSQREEYEAAAVQLEKSARALQLLLARLERQRKEEVARARAEGRNPQPYSGEFVRGQGQLEWPVRGPVIGHFGPEKHPRFGTMTLNNGMDIQAAVGTAVRSVAKGRVDFTNEDYASYGEVIILNHGDGYYTLYAHLSEILVSVGQEVIPGQVIGRSGDTGSLKGPILHFEVRKGGSALNPEDWLQ